MFTKLNVVYHKITKVEFPVRTNYTNPDQSDEFAKYCTTVDTQ